MAGDGDFAEVSRQLSERIDALAAQLLPAGVLVQRSYWRVGSLAGEPGQSLCVYFTGARRGRWRDFSSGEYGDALDLVAAVLYGGDLVEAIKWARDWLGISDEIDPETRKKLAERAEARRAERQRQAEREALHKRQDALRIWLKGKPITRGDVVDKYLLGRGIDLRRLGKAPRALRTHPSLHHPDGKSWPAMVAAVCDASGKHCATHRTWLTDRNLACDPHPVVKAPVGNAKMTLGAYAGGCIRLGRGETGKPWSQMVEGEPLLIGEGIEDVLSAMLEWPEYRAICALSLSSMMTLELPEAVGDVLLLQQKDPAGSSAANLLRRVVDRFYAMGHKVYFWQRPVFVKDYNEKLNHSALIGATL